MSIRFLNNIKDRRVISWMRRGSLSLQSTTTKTIILALFLKIKYTLFEPMIGDT
jgi:hypothetical protein